MTREDFKTRLADINAKYEQEKKRLYSQYAHENSTVEVDDIVEDHIGCGRVLKMKTTFAAVDEYPSLVYVCMEVKKDGTPKKKETFREIYQINVKKVNGKPVKYEGHE
jgi:hypothetical protein